MTWLWLLYILNFPENRTHICYSLLGLSYNHLQYMFKTQLIIFTFPSAFPFFLSHMTYVLVNTTTTSHCQTRERLWSHQGPFPGSHIYLLGYYLLSFLPHKSFKNNLSFSLSLLLFLNSRPHYFPLGLLQ